MGGGHPNVLGVGCGGGAPPSSPLPPPPPSGCDNCNEWFHGDCINITEKMAKAIREWYCRQCRGEGPPRTPPQPSPPPDPLPPPPQDPLNPPHNADPPRSP